MGTLSSLKSGSPCQWQARHGQKREPLLIPLVAFIPKKNIHFAITCIWNCAANYPKTMGGMVHSGRFLTKWRAGRPKIFWKLICLNLSLPVRRRDYGVAYGGMILGPRKFT